MDLQKAIEAKTLLDEINKLQKEFKKIAILLLLMIFAQNSKSQQRDTVSCILVVVDTVGCNRYVAKSLTIKAMSGYEVRKWIPGGWGDRDQIIYPHWEHESYLYWWFQPINNKIVIYCSSKKDDTNDSILDILTH